MDGFAVVDGENKKKKKNHDNNKGGKCKRTRLSELKTLGQQLLSSRAHVNNLPLLLTFVDPSSQSPPHYTLEALLSLQAFFTPFIPQLPPSTSSSVSSSDKDGDPEFIYRTWLRSKFDQLVQYLIDISVSASQSEDALREVALDTLMDFVKVANAGKFHSSIYHRFLHTIVYSSLAVEDVVLDLLESKYFKYIDVRYFTYISLEKFARALDSKNVSGERNSSTSNGSQPGASMELSTHKIYHMLSHIPPLEGADEEKGHEMWNGLGIFITKKEDPRKDDGRAKSENKKKIETKKSVEKVLSGANVAKKMRLKFTKAWISFLRLPLPLDVYKEVLVTLHQAVIPHLSNPIMLCDFLTRSYDIGGVVSVMALSSLFVLMTQHGLEYPNFYEKLYALLEPSIFMAKHRSKFFQLLDSCLKSPLLPAYLAAAFTKKLSRLSLSVPPSGALVIIALIHNLLRRHPSINCLVHREISNDAANGDSGVEDGTVDTVQNRDQSSCKAGIDHFNNEQTDPLKTNAMRSSLWEIDTLRHHYCPPVSRFVLSLENDLTVRAKTTEVAVKDFSSGSYGTIFNEEIRRRVKQVPLAFYKTTPTSLFSESDFPGWSFKSKDDEPNTLADGKTRFTSEEQDGHSSVKRQRVEQS